MVRARLAALAMVAFGLPLFAPPASAQDTMAGRIELSALDLTPALLSASAAPAVRLADADQIPMAPIVAQRPKLGKSGLLNSLYASTVLMQGLDVHSTLKAFGAGAVEGNPLMSGVTKNRAAFIATKATIAAVTILATRKLAKKHKVAAVITLIAVNSAYAMIVRHNYNLARR